ncbi:MAG: TolC family outer membrane protein [Gammaproteobacteria bacterium]|nr:TolC family outer membrane protein [Gammaproteobacteria bacterium]MBU1733203.1 TolC family outer membrane protein [Gammaproteobacteria bacterium]MBU1892251.1 TolC family outer membrane protein [Gammaproteobacteria bacterium]
MKRLTLALLIATAFAPSTQAANLMDIYRDALANDAALASARAAYQAGQEKLPQGRALLLPSLDLGASTIWNEEEIQTRSNGITTDYNYNSNGAKLTLMQPIYRRQNWAEYEQGKLQSAVAEIQYAAAQQGLILNVAQAYFDVLLAQDNVTLAATQKKAIQEQLDQAKMSFEVGTATITDTHEAQARFDLANASEIAALNDLEIRQRALEKIIGKLPGSLATLAADLSLQAPEPNDISKWVEAAEHDNLLVQTKRISAEIANQEVERNRGGHHPTLDLVATYGDSSLSGGRFGAYDTKAATIGLQLGLPLYQGGAASSRVREAVANQEKARQDLTLEVRQSALSTREAYLGVTSGAAQVRALEQALVSSQSSLDSTRLGLEVGVRTNVDVLNAQQQLFSAKRDLYKARYAYLVSRLKLKSAAGTLAEGDLQQVNQWLK